MQTDKTVLNVSIAYWVTTHWHPNVKHSEPSTALLEMFDKEGTELIHRVSEYYECDDEDATAKIFLVMSDWTKEIGLNIHKYDYRLSYWNCEDFVRDLQGELDAKRDAYNRIHGDHGDANCFLNKLLTLNHN